jgi:hypothetical protein
VTRGTILRAAAVSIVAAAVIGGLMLVGPPAAERARRIDARRVDDLSAISRAVDVYHERQRRMPAALGDLAATSGPTVATTDPSSGLPYEYRVLEGNRYEICATFSDASEQRRYTDFWAHGAGRQCFQLEVRAATR